MGEEGKYDCRKGNVKNKSKEKMRVSMKVGKEMERMNQMWKGIHMKVGTEKGKNESKVERMINMKVRTER